MAHDPEIKDLAQRLHRWPAPKYALRTLSRMTSGTEIVTLHTGSMTGGRQIVIATTSDRVIIAINRAVVDPPAIVLQFSDLAACIWFAGNAPTLVSLVLAPVRFDERLVEIRLDGTADTARSISASVNPAINEARDARVEGHWSATLPDAFAVAFDGMLLSEPAKADTRPERVRVVAMNAGLALERPDERHSFIPWQSVDAVAVEGVDQVRNRPSVGAVVAFGVLGLAARRKESEAYLVIETADGAWALELPNMVPAKVRADLSPVLRSLSTGTGHSALGVDQDDVVETIRRLGGLRDEGLLSEDEFNAKKVDLLGRL
jgi:hypothetical protein